MCFFHATASLSLNPVCYSVIQSIQRSPEIMATSDEKLCLQWNDFKENVSSAFGDLREEKEFSDVTLACEDGQQVEAHKVVLVASSPFFLNILKRNKHPHPLIYLRGVGSENLLAIVDFLYHGQANVYQENLDSFLALAEELELKGLRGKTTAKVPEEYPEPKTQQLKTESQKSEASKSKIHFNKGFEQAADEKALALIDHTTNSTDMEGLDQQVRSMMTLSEKADKIGNRIARICIVCGKEGDMTNIKSHIEANHITGISIPWGLCGQSFKSRNALRKHKSLQHRNQ